MTPMAEVGGRALLATPAGAPEPRAADLRDYALASCLVRQDASTALKEQGSYLGSIVLERSDGASVGWEPLYDAVVAALARTEVAMVHVDAPVGDGNAAAPLATCLSVIDDPAVRRAMARLSAPRR